MCAFISRVQRWLDRDHPRITRKRQLRRGSSEVRCGGAIGRARATARVRSNPSSNVEWRADIVFSSVPRPIGCGAAMTSRFPARTGVRRPDPRRRRSVVWSARSSSCHEKARLPARHLERADQVRMKPSTSVSAQASVFSIGSPCMWRTVILVMVPWVKICAAILGGAGEPAIDGIAWLCGLG